MLTDAQQRRTREDARLRRRRSPKLIALGVLCVVLGALAAAAVYAMNVVTVDVVATTRDVTRGDTITAADLTVIQVPRNAANGATPADRLDSFVGATALSDLPKGAFPASRHIGQQALPQGHSLVGLSMETGRIPTTGLSPGAAVTLVDIESSTVIPATVATTPQLQPHGNAYLLDVVVARDQAPTVAALAAVGQLAMVAEGDG